MKNSIETTLRIAACYIRVSTDEQIENSPESQLKEIQKYADENGYYIPDEYVFRDEGISGRNADKRPEFQRMIATAKKKPKPFDAVLLWKFSRFARNKTDAVVYKNMLRKDCGIDVISISEHIGEDKGTAVILESLFEAMDEYYSINLSTEVTRSMKMKAEKGEPNCPAPFGYLNDRENKSYKIDPERADIIKYIFSSYASGVGMRAIAMELNAKGIRTKRGNTFDNRLIEYILMNPTYIGKTRWTVGRQNSRKRYKNGCDKDTIVAQGTHTPLIDEKLFEEVQKMLKEQKQKYGKYQRPEASSEWMLRGLIRCNECGATVFRANTKTPSLQCGNYSRGQCTTSHYIPIARANTLVIEGIEAALNSADFILEHKTASQTQTANADIIRRAIESENRKLKKVREAYEEGIDTIEEYKANKERITNKIKSFQAELDSISETPTTDIPSFTKKISAVLDILKNDTVSEKAKNEALRAIVSKIVFFKPENKFEIHFYD
jgi:DNA invertase Pin-like site-specific DNA recombinase